jgi:hypothetical protein
MREWVRGLFGLDAVKAQTVRCQRTVLAVVHSPVMITANIPLGILADRWSRKRVLYLATCAEGLRNPYLRDLGAIDSDCAIAGITRERPGGLLRRSGPATSIMTALNPLFAPPATERWRESTKLLARTRARALLGRANLGRDFCAPLAGDLACLTAGRRPGEWQRLNMAGTRANALVLTGHGGIGEARTEPHYSGRSPWV